MRDKYQWHKWYAWYPIKLGNSWIWLTYIWRKKAIGKRGWMRVNIMTKGGDNFHV